MYKCVYMHTNIKNCIYLGVSTRFERMRFAASIEYPQKQ